MIQKTMGKFKICFFNKFGVVAREFEDSLRLSQTPPLQVMDDHGMNHDICWPQLSFWNSYLYAEEQSRKYFVFQFLNTTNLSEKFQFIVYVDKSRLNYFKQGVIRQWTTPFLLLSSEEIFLVLNCVIEVLKKNTDLMSLKIQPYLPGKLVIENLKSIFAKLGFFADSSESPAQTRFLDIRPSLEEVFNSFSQRLKSKSALKKSEETAVIMLVESSAILGMQRALDHAFLRTTGKRSLVLLEPFLKLFCKNPKVISILGFFCKDDLVNPLAFVIGVNHGPIMEYSMGGSITDPKLRRFSFNSILFWKLIEVSKQNGCELFDLGGVSSGASDDPTAGIAQFKRQYPGFELSVGFGAQRVLRPIQFRLFQAIKFFAARLSLL